jgi:hypothetical protein
MKLIRLLLITSLLLNLAGGAIYLKRRFYPTQANQPRWQETPTYRGRTDVIAASLRAAPSAVVFLGDSVTAWGNWPNAVNAGIEGDEVKDVAARAGDVAAAQPARVFLMAGINDLMHDKTPEAVAAEYRLLVSGILAKSPATRLIVQSILPVRESLLAKFPTGINERIRQTNRLLSALPQVVFVDLHSKFTDSNGSLDSRLTFDGLHLNSSGYQLWRECLIKQGL